MYLMFSAWFITLGILHTDPVFLLFCHFVFNTIEEFWTSAFHLRTCGLTTILHNTKLTVKDDKKTGSEL